MKSPPAFVDRDRSHLGIVDGILVELTSPAGASFTIDELIKNHGYPRDDPSEFDVAWF